MPQHASLFGEYDVTLDDKHRVLVPADIRKVLNPETEGRAFFVIVGPNRRPWLYTEIYWNELAAQLQQQIAPDEDLLEFEQMQFARARRLELDNAGRILLPEKTLRRTNTGREVTIIGVRDHLEIWNRDDWEIHEADLTSRMAEITRRFRGVQLNPVAPAPATPKGPLG